MEITANAKINLCLDVVKRREDGYHEMAMIMVPLSLADTLVLSKWDRDELVCKVSGVPMDERNTMIKALRVMREAFGFDQCFRMELIKRIPMEAGMAGGSADGAALMRGVWELMKLPCTLEELSLLGKKVGADVPFCIMNTCSLVQGIGEIVTPFQSACSFYVLLVKPKRGVSTKEAFQTLDFRTCAHPDAVACKKNLEAGDASKFYQHSGNTLEESAIPMVPEIAFIKQELYTHHFDFVLMSGSGSTVFALTQEKEILETGYQAMKHRYEFVEKSKTI